MSLSKSSSNEGDYADDTKFSRTIRLCRHNVMVNDPTATRFGSSDSENNFPGRLQNNELKNTVDLLGIRVDKLEELLSAVNESTITNSKKCINILRNLKKQKFVKKIKPEPISRNITDCKLCDNIDKIHEHDDFRKILFKINLYDSLILHQYNLIKKFECLVCLYNTNDVNGWKLHILSKYHSDVCHNTKDTLYSYVCDTVKCKVLLFGSEEFLSEHMKKHLREFNIACLSILMVEVMNHYMSKEECPLYFCGHCNRLGYQPIHNDVELLTVKKPNYIEYYCEYCRVAFMCAPELWDCHSLSVQHTTLKCIAVISEDLNNKNSIKNPLLMRTLKLPYIVLKEYERIVENYGKCVLCCMVIDWTCSNLVLHLHECVYKRDMAITNKTMYMKYACFVCAYYAVDINDHISHITSCDHLTKCYDTQNLYSYFCESCNTYIYGHGDDINDHRNLHNPLSSTEFPTFSTFMANVFMDINTPTNTNGFVLYIGDIEPNKSLTDNSFYCYECKVEFKSVYDYELHQITNEHIIIVFTTREKEKYLNEHLNLTTASEMKTSKPSEVQDNPSCSTQSIVNELQSPGLKKEPINIDANCSAQLDGDGDAQVPLTMKEMPTEEIKRVEISYEDKTYGNYVAERLKNIENRAIKNIIKLKIDGIFYSEMKQMK